MLRTSISKLRRSHGFTIVELIVIVTVLAILTPLVLTGLGNFYQANISSLRQSTQDTGARGVLRTVEKDLAYSPSFLASQTVTSPLLGPSSSASGPSTWTANRDTLIAYTYATATSSGVRVPVFYQPSGSDCDQPTSGMMLRNTIIYFVAVDPSNSSINNLYRRTIVGTTPTGTPCPGTPATLDQKTTCRPTVASGACTRSAQVGSDTLVMRDVDRLTLEYYALATSTTPLSASSDPASAQSAKISILPKKRGNVVPEEVSIRITPIR